MCICAPFFAARVQRAKVRKNSDICKFFGWKVYIAAKMPQKMPAFADLFVILIYGLFLFLSQKEQVSLKLASFSCALIDIIKKDTTYWLCL
jgi:hypothetical protein